jgi:DNA-binding CsgD family transcriptional regulator
MAVLDRMQCGGVILDAAGQVLDLNTVARRILATMQPKVSSETVNPENARGALKGLLRAGDTRFAIDQDTWAAISRDDQRQLLVHAVQLSKSTGAGPHTMVILIDLEHWPKPNPITLQKIFGLTPAEANLAVQIAQGEPLADIARANHISIATARTQLAHVFAKTRTHRQADLVALLARVAILP